MMQIYTVEFWAEYHDQPTDFEVDIEASSEEEAIKKVKSSSKLARRGKKFKVIKIKNKHHV